MSETKNVQSVRATVVKKSSPQTIRVATKITKVHPLYKKRYSRLQYYVAHDPSDAVEVGQEVTIVPCRPISKNKRWMVKN